jgi:hypothetical protein
MITRQNVKFDGGLQIQRPIIFAELNGGFFGRGDTFDISFKATDTAFVNNMKYAYINVTLMGTDKVLNAGPAAAFSTVETKMKNASLTMAKKLATAFYQDGQSYIYRCNNLRWRASTNQSFDGLLAWVDDGSTFGSYATATNASKSFAAVGGITRSDILATNSTADATPDANVGGINSYVNRAFNAFTLADINVAYGNSQFGNDSV